jgi:hypothetical protein
MLTRMARGRCKRTSAFAMVSLAGLAAGTTLPARAAETLSPARVRVYSKPSREVYGAVVRLVRELNIAGDKDDEHQSVVTWWHPVTHSPSAPPKIWPRRGDQIIVEAEELELHIFVSP